jgi:O-antigen/teichoic acid export membrane protein
MSGTGAGQLAGGVDLGADQGDRTRDLAFLARGGALNLVGGVSTAVLTYAFYFIAARSLTTSELGAFFVANAVFLILTTTLQLGAQVGFIRFIPQYRVLGRAADVRTSLVVGAVPVLALSTVAAVGLHQIAPRLAGVFDHGQNGQEVVRFLQLLAWFVPAGTAFMLLMAATVGFGTMLPSLVLDKVGETAAQVAGAVIAAAGLGASFYAIAWGAPYALFLVLAVLWLLRLLRRAERRAGADVASTGWRNVAKEFWVFSAPRGLASVFQVAVLWLDTVLIGAIASTQEAGIYSIATRYLVIGQVAVRALLQVVGPKLSEVLAAGRRDRAQAVYETTTTWLIGIVWPVYLSVAVFAPLLLRVFGEQYVEGQTPLLILAGAMLVAVASGPVDMVLLMGGRSWWSVVNWGAALVVNIALNVILIPRIGMSGAAVAWTASILVRNVIPVVEVWFILGIHPFGRGYTRAVLGACATFGVVGITTRLVLGPTPVAFVLYAAVGGALYALVLRRFRGELDLHVLKDSVRRRNRSTQLVAS